MRGSLRVRLLVSVLALLLPAAAAAGVLLVQVFGDRLLRDLDVALEEEAATIAALVNRPSDAISIPALLGQISDETDLGAGKRVVVRRGQTVIGESPAGSAAVLDQADGTWRLGTAAAGPTAEPLTVVVAVPATAAMHATRRLRLLLAVGIRPALVLAAGLWLVMGRAATARDRRPAHGAIGAVICAGFRSSDDDEVGRMVAHSTACWIGWPRRSPSCSALRPTRRTSCGRRSPCARGTGGDLTRPRVPRPIVRRWERSTQAARSAGGRSVGYSPGDAAPNRRIAPLLAEMLKSSAMPGRGGRRRMASRSQ
jgi:hypothetical protein